MAILRIEEVTYGVDDLDLCARFFSDVGLEMVARTASLASFRTPVNQFINLRLLDDPQLPPAAVAGPNLRELIWGVDDSAGLAAIESELSRDRPVTRDDRGTLHCRDETGYGLAFKLAKPTAIQVTPRPTNVLNSVGRLNAGVVARGQPRPLRIIHAALDIRAEDRQRANDFYTERLGFRAVDRVLPMGTFMQCEGDIEHHNFLLCHRPDRVSINHIALEVRDIDEVIEAGNYMTVQGWKESRRLGRHNLGSNVFRMFHAPCGGRIEFAADMDRMDKNFKPRVWDQTPPHHLWMVKFPGDAERDEATTSTTKGITDE